MTLCHRQMYILRHKMGVILRLSPQAYTLQDFLWLGNYLFFNYLYKKTILSYIAYYIM